MSDKQSAPSRKQKRRKRRKIFLIVEIIVLLILLGLLFVWLKVGMINFKDIGTIKQNVLSKETEKTLSGYTNFALFGVDNRQNGNYEGGQSDVIVIVSINNDTKKIRMASVYRDSFLDVGQTEQLLRKCNYAYAHGGESAALEMLNKNLDLNLQDFVAVDFAAVTDAIDAVGGIEMDVTPDEIKGLNDPDRPILREMATQLGKEYTPVTQPGKQKLNGLQATAYCRIRHYAGDDWGRAKRQRAVIEALLGKVKGASLSQMSSLVDAILPKVYTSYSGSEIISMAMAAKEYSIEQSFGFPFKKVPEELPKPYGSVVIPCSLESNVRKLHEKMFDEKNYSPSNTVSALSQQIISITGKDENSAIDYSKIEENKGIEDTQSSSENTTQSGN
ncbi:transcriptional attenuator, LytR family [Lachnospiraceae bacterium C10]|nr:transcriptional attenuator, LytR family [Lachnospiraceae bacterium C10]